MRDIARTRENYIFAGLSTLSRQVLFQMDEWLDELRYPRFQSPLAWKVLGTSIHKARYAEKLTSTAMTYAVTLVEQEAYPLLLQISGEDAELMAVTLELEEKRLSYLKLLMPSLAILNGLAWVSYGNFIEAFEAQMACHQRVLKCYNDSWTWMVAIVTEVIDGDTMYVYGVESSIRFSGIDCPEIWHEDDPGEPGDERYRAGREAAAYTTSRLKGQWVRLKLYTKRDIYDRHIAKVYIYSTNKSFETELVREGHAVFKYYR